MTKSRTYHVTVIEWLSHKAVIEAASPEEADHIARTLWLDNREHERFRFADSGIDGVTVEEMLP